MKKAAFAALALLVLACGSSGIELNNATGMDLDRVTLTIGDNTRTWENVEADQTLGASLDMIGENTTVRVEWEYMGTTEYLEYMLVENAAEASRVSILFAPDEVSISYSF